MAAILIYASSYSLSNSTYLSVSNPGNMLGNMNVTTYATLTHNRASTSTYYMYLGGFDFSNVNIPANATVTEISVQIRARGLSLSSSTPTMSLYNGSTSITNTSLSSNPGAGDPTLCTFPTGNLTWDTLKTYTNFRIRIPIKRSSSNISASYDIYGAVVQVLYTLPGHTVTLSTEANDISAIGYDGST